MSTNGIKLRLPGKPEYIKICQDTVMSSAVAAGFDANTAEDIGMATVEACKAVVCHGYDFWCDEYELEIDISSDEFKIEIASSSAHNVKKQCEICLDCPNEGDLGVFVIKSIMDRINVENKEDGGKKITLVKKYAR